MLSHEGPDEQVSAHPEVRAYSERALSYLQLPSPDLSRKVRRFERKKSRLKVSGCRLPAGRSIAQLVGIKKSEKQYIRSYDPLRRKYNISKDPESQNRTSKPNSSTTLFLDCYFHLSLGRFILSFLFIQTKYFSHNSTRKTHNTRNRASNALKCGPLARANNPRWAKETHTRYNSNQSSSHNNPSSYSLSVVLAFLQ